MIAGNPTASSASCAASSEATSRLFGDARPILSIAWRNSWRSSALAIASSLAPISSISWRAKTPERANAIAVFSAVWPPIVGNSASIACPAWRSRTMICSTTAGVIGSI